MKILLFQPQIPQNTGNIVRTCSVTGVSLVLVKPYGFSLSDKMVKRAGLDYWEEVQIEEIDSLEKYLEKASAPFYFFSSKAEKSYTEVSYPENSILIFGAETSGLPPLFHKRWPHNFVTLPMLPTARCLNLSNAVAIATYEALRQQEFTFSYGLRASK